MKKVTSKYLISILCCLFLINCSSLNSNLFDGNSNTQNAIDAPAHPSQITLINAIWQNADKISFNRLDSGRATFYEIEAIAEGSASEYNWIGQEAYGKVTSGAVFQINGKKCIDLRHEITRNNQNYVGIGTVCETNPNQWDVLS